MGRRKGNFKPRANWHDIVRENQDWEDYYKAQNLVSEEEFAALKASFQEDLPMTFRITDSDHSSKSVLNMLETRYLEKLQNITYNGVLVQPPSPLPFMPERMGWQIDVAKQVIRKTPEFASLQKFLVLETAVGHISRQESVSMVPPLFMDIKSHHRVLDMCAAPGSKTAQLIEALHSENDYPEGLVVANDADYKRSHMLTHQIKRLNSPNAIITNHDAQLFPKIKLGGNKILKFDRILCDVPCSGDGTLRKNVTVWKDWVVGNGLGLHQLQLNIATRGCQLLEAGGRLVYSTCSLNPIENEAVVAELLRKFPDLELHDLTEELPGLKRFPGLNTWKVMAKDKTWQSSETSTLPKSMFPPTDDEVEKLKLDRSIRIYPHQQNTGGFYVAVFNKKETEPSRKRQRVEVPATDVPAAEDSSTTVAEADSSITPSKKLPRDAVEEPFHLLASDHPVIESIWKFYGIHDLSRDTLLVRNQTGDPVRTIYYVAPILKEILECNDKKLKAIYAGIKLFVQQKNEGDCKWRIQSEGLRFIYPYLSPSRIVKIESDSSLRTLCIEAFPKFNEVKEFDESLYDQVIKLDEGCCVLVLGESRYPLWRGRASINLMLGKENTEELLLRHFNEVTPANFQTNKKKAGNEPVAEHAVESVEENVNTANEDTDATDEVSA